LCPEDKPLCTDRERKSDINYCAVNAIFAHIHNISEPKK
jgi:hypothetical protein